MKRNRFSVTFFVVVVLAGCDVRRLSPPGDDAREEGPADAAPMMSPPDGPPQDVPWEALKPADAPTDLPWREVNTSGPAPPAGVYGPCSATCPPEVCVTSPQYGGVGSFCSKVCMVPDACPVPAGVGGSGICLLDMACALRCVTDADCFAGGFCDMGADVIGKICVYPT